MSKPSKIFFLLIFIFSILELSQLLNGTSYNRANAFGYFASLFYLLFFGFVRYKRIRMFFKPSIKSFTLLSIIGAIYVELCFWLGQQVFNTSKVAISDNLLIGLIMILPYYALLGYLFAKKNMQFKFSIQQLLFIGAAYEVIADGIVGNIIVGNFAGVTLSPLLIPVFAIVYSPIIFVPYKILSENSIKSFRKGHLKNIVVPYIAVLILPLSIGIGIFLENLIIN